MVKEKTENVRSQVFRKKLIISLLKIRIRPFAGGVSPASSWNYLPLVDPKRTAERYDRPKRAVISLLASHRHHDLRGRGISKLLNNNFGMLFQTPPPAYL
jgi:hypothetical protein